MYFHSPWGAAQQPPLASGEEIMKRIHGATDPLRELAHLGLARHEDTPREHPLLLLHVRAVGQRAHPVIEVPVADSRGVHLLSVGVDLVEHVAEVPLEVVAPVPPRDVLETRLLDEVDVHGRPAHERRGVAIGERLERLLVGAVRAHDVGKDEDAAGL